MTSGFLRTARRRMGVCLSFVGAPVLALVLALALALGAPSVRAQTEAAGGEPRGFAGLGEQAEGFAEVQSDRPLRFPADHRQHPDYRIEWWYFTANLRDLAGRAYGVQWTLFRQALVPSDDRATAHARAAAGDDRAEDGLIDGADGRDAGWRSRQFFMGHAALTSAKTHRFAERFARGGVGQAGVDGPPFQAWLDDWSAAGDGPGIDTLRLHAKGADFAYDLSLAAAGPIVLQGRDGFSVKSAPADGPPQASYYYSQPHYRASGRLMIDGKSIEVSGKAWFDHEWSSQPLSPAQIGWDWFSLRLDSGEKVMMFQLNRSDGAPPDRAGTWIDPEGRAQPLDPAEIRIAALDDPGPAGGAPTRWRLEAPSRGFSVETRPLNPDAWQDGSVPYWEGPIFVSGSHAGEGYLEMTGRIP